MELFGVSGAEALVIGAVALLVLGPRGMSDLARRLLVLRAHVRDLREALARVGAQVESGVVDGVGLEDMGAGVSEVVREAGRAARAATASVVDGQGAPRPRSER